MKGALTRFRVMAYVVGVFLLLLVVAMVRIFRRAASAHRCGVRAFCHYCKKFV